MGTIAYLSLGSNLGNRSQILEDAITEISRTAGSIVALSNIYETAPWGFNAEQEFLNLCVAIRTTLSPLELLFAVQSIEVQFGRKRIENSGYQSRTLDIDIITYGNEIINHERISVPHPHMQKRKFVLLPLQEIAPQFEHPKSKKRIQCLIEECEDDCTLKIYTCNK
jgi:2-amino-4-hydroxy-6-hydroxymethyldihydropteridine diphosphokinase